MPDTSQTYRPLLPAKDAPNVVRSSQPLAALSPTVGTKKRQLIAAACAKCRKRKIKCDGKRPSCSACLKVSANCLYDTGPGETRTTALKRNFSNIENDRAELNELLYLMRSRSEPEAIGILQHLRSTPDASATLKFVKDGDLLLQASRGHSSSVSGDHGGVAHPIGEQPTPTENQFVHSNSLKSSLALKRKHSSTQYNVDQLLGLLQYIRAAPEAEVIEIMRRIRSADSPFSILGNIQNGDPKMQQHLGESWVNGDNIRLKELDAAALRQSPIKVRARPWTNVAGDGIVSQLVSIFFTQELFLMPFVDRHTFVAEMNTGSQDDAQSASPLLVNAICACSAYTSSFVKAFDRISHGGLRLQFYDEARKLLDNERGRPSSTTTQALLILFMFNSANGTDRAGTVFRFAGCKMFKRLRLGATLEGREDANDQKYDYRGALAQNAWGMFHFENYCAFAYLQPSLIPVPEIPRYFLNQHNRAKEREIPVATENVLDLQCNLAQVFYRIVTYCTSPAGDLGRSEDLQARKLFYNEVLEAERAIPPQSLFELQWAYLHGFLRAFHHIAAIAILRPILNLNTTFTEVDCTPAVLCIDHCTKIINQMNSWKLTRPIELGSGSISSLNLCYMCAFTLVPLLDSHPASREPFSEICGFLARFAAYWPAAEALLKGSRALAQQLGMSLPQESLPHFAGAFVWSDPNDVPVSWSIPQYENLLDELSVNVDDTANSGVDLGRLIHKWSSLSIQP